MALQETKETPVQQEEMAATAVLASLVTRVLQATQEFKVLQAMQDPQELLASEALTEALEPQVAGRFDLFRLVQYL